MRRLSQTIARLSAMSRMPRIGEDATVPDRLDELTGFGSNPGALRAWTYVPPALTPGAGLVVVLHGCTQTAAGYDHGAGWSQLAEAHGFAVLLPEQQRANNPNACFNWFVPGDIARGRGEAASIAQMVTAMVAAHRIDPARGFVTGLSAGGAMTSVMLATYPDMFAGGAIIAGLPHGTATSVGQALERMGGQGGADGPALTALVRGASEHQGDWPTVSVWHGTADATVAASNADAVVAQWRTLHGATGAGETGRVDGHPHTAWRNRAGRVVVEQHAITGLGHGTPLATGGEEGCGVAGPYMLEAGISSTRHIARRWGLLVDAPARVAAPTAQPGAQSGVQPPAAPPRGAGLASALAQRDPARIIADALKAAGLGR